MSKGKSYLSSGTGVNLALLRDVLRRDLLDFVEKAPAGRSGKVGWGGGGEAGRSDGDGWGKQVREREREKEREREREKGCGGEEGRRRG